MPSSRFRLLGKGGPILLIMLLAHPSLAKSPLSHSDYDQWSSLTNTSISPDGNWVVYTIDPRKPDTPSTLHVRHTNDTSKKYAFSRGTSARFTDDSRWLVLLIAPNPDAIKQARKAKKKPEEFPKNQLVVLDLNSGQQRSRERVKNFRLPSQAGGLLAYLGEPKVPAPAKQEVKPTGESSKPSNENKSGESAGEHSKELKQGVKGVAKVKPRSRPQAAGKGKGNTPDTWWQQPAQPSKSRSQNKTTQKASSQSEANKEDAKKPSKPKGTTLVLWRLDQDEQTSFAHVTNYEFTRDGTRLAVITDGPQDHQDGVAIIATKSRKSKVILSGKGNYQSLNWDHGGNHLAFLTNRDDQAAKQPRLSLYDWAKGMKQARMLLKDDHDAMPEGFTLASRSPSFSRSGKRIFFRLTEKPKSSPKPLPSNKQATAEDDPDAKTANPKSSDVTVDIWHWQDSLLQPMQLLQVSRSKNRSHQAVVDRTTGKVVRLGDAELGTVVPGNRGDARVGVLSSSRQYRKLISWESPRFSDVYLVDLTTGHRTQILTRVQGSASLSPLAKYLYWWDNTELAWKARPVHAKKAISLSQDIPYPVHNERHDTPNRPRGYGIAGWLEGDQGVVIYDRYDLWLVDPRGVFPPVCITDGVGRANSIRFRFVRVEDDQRFLPTDQPILLSAFHERTKAAGYYHDQISVHQPPTKLIMLDEQLGSLKKAKDVDRYILTRQTFVRYPDLWVCDSKFHNLKQLSDTNPQQANYSWGTAELVEWNSLDGIPLQGILYKPDGFDPTKKYPMMVYFYERFSDRFHRYVSPAPGTSINVSFYVSRGYVVFIPDITYTVGSPGQSCLNAVLPGVTNLVQQGFIDKDKIGVQGHSWGGYQITYLVTRTHLFAAAEAGAPVSNMTSAYGGIRWSSGMSRMFQYEKTQSRIGGTLWDAQQKYIENSPIFWADRVQTPLLMLHNDKDGAVPWYQGIEMFVALRRLNKPAWLVNYNGEAHGLRKRDNQKDWTIRMQQFFDHYLKDAPPPVWLAEGIPAVEKGKNLGLDLIETPETQVSGDSR